MPTTSTDNLAKSLQLAFCQGYFKCCQLSLKEYVPIYHVLDEGSHWATSMCQTPWVPWPTFYLLQSPREPTLSCFVTQLIFLRCTSASWSCKTDIHSKGELLENSNLHATWATSWSAPLIRLPGKLWLHLHPSLSPSSLQTFKKRCSACT